MAWPVNASIPHLGWQPGLTASYRSLRDRCKWRQRVAPHRLLVQLIPAPGAAQSSEWAPHVSECTLDASGDDGAAIWLIRRLGRASADGRHVLPLKVNAGMWASWTFEMNLNVSKEFLDARGAALVTSFRFWPVDPGGGDVPMPPLHNHHSTYGHEGLARAAITPEYLRDFPPMRTSIGAGSAADYGCVEEDGGDECKLKQLPRGYARTLPQSAKYSIVLNDVRPRGDPYAVWYECALRLLRPSPAAAVRDVAHLTWGLPSGGEPQHTRIDGAMFKTFELPRALPSLHCVTHRWPRAGRIVSEWWHGHHRFTSVGFVLSGDVESRLRGLIPGASCGQRATATPLRGKDALGPANVQKLLANLTAGGDVRHLCSYEPRRVARAPVAGEAAQLFDRAAVGPAAAPSCAGARVRRGEQLTVLCLNAAGGDAPHAGQHCVWDMDVAFEHDGV